MDILINQTNAMLNPVKINLSTEVVTLKAGKEETVTATAEPARNEITWTSADSTVATVSDGRIKVVETWSEDHCIVTSSKTYYSSYTGNLKALTQPAAPASVKAKRTSKVSTKSTATISFKKVDRASTYRIYKYNKKTKKYVIAYRVVNNKLYQYNGKTKKYSKVNNVKVKNGILTCSLKNLNLKSEKSQKYVVKATVSKSGYTTQYSANSKVVTIK